MADTSYFDDIENALIYLNLQSPLPLEDFSNIIEPLLDPSENPQLNNDGLSSQVSLSVNQWEASRSRVGETNPDQRTSESSYAQKRKRAANINLKDLKDYLHLPIKEASKQVKLCTTVLQKICRKGGLGRWPQRKIQAWKKRILNLKANLSLNDTEKKARAQAEIQRLEQKMEDFYSRYSRYSR